MNGKYCKLLEQRTDLIKFIKEKELERIETDLFNFTHDFYGIIDHIARDQFPATNFEGFIPRFASKK